MRWLAASAAIYLIGFPWGAALTRLALMDMTPWLWASQRGRRRILMLGGLAWPALAVILIMGASSMIMDRWRSHSSLSRRESPF
jgi:hypothetical protein